MEQECKLFFRLMNVDGLTDGKLDIIKETFINKEKEYNIICMTETHHRYEKQKDRGEIDRYRNAKTETQTQEKRYTSRETERPELRDRDRGRE